MNRELTNLDDGSIKVCIEKNNLRVCGFVGSAHLIEPKVNQLIALYNGEGLKLEVEDDDDEFDYVA